MSVRKIAYLAPLYFDEQCYLGGGERYPLNLAKGVVESSGGNYEVELVSFGPTSFRREIAPGVSLRILTAAGKPVAPVGHGFLGTSRGPGRCRPRSHPPGLHTLFRARPARRQATPQADLRHRPRRDLQSVRPASGDPRPGRPDHRLLRLRRIALPDLDPDRIIKGGVDASRFTPPPSPVKRDRVLFVGRLLPHKGIDRSIAAMPPELPLTVCGRPYDEGFFRRSESGRGEASRVRHRRRR